MTTLKELRDAQNVVVSQARERLDLITANTDEARQAELETAHDKAMAEFDRLEGLIVRETKLAEIEKRAEDLRIQRRPSGEAVEARGVDSAPAIEYRTVFAKAICGSLENLTAEERAVLKTGSTEFRAQSTGVTTAGGFFIPTELAATIIRSMLAWGPMYDPGVSTEMVTSSGNPIRIPTVDDTAVTAVTHTENTALTDTGAKDVTIGQKSLDAFAFDTQFIRWSWELDADSIFGMEALLGDLLGERLGRIANLQLTTGSGTGAPNGIVTASSLGKTAAAVAAITFDEIIDLEHSVDPAYRTSPRAAFMMNDSVLQAVRKLKDGQGNYLWQNGNVQAGVPGTINGRPFYINQAMASQATGARVMLFGDFSKYFVRKVGAPVIGVMRERFWPDLGIAGLIRFDGELSDAAAVKHLKNA
ncbi:phage major capsid protein [Phenylobacterium sp.]|uniref:phage major capsid protein n=1 Tax=Phenylobacterium sp. TaxID=1871053 RepID=UPI0025E85C04|nr:phage major capsid protein [Phenylobacterium sp.]MCA6347229.1 phage major capsid protein [Phenylobacterium sp.]